MSRDLRTMNMEDGQRIESDEVLKRIGDLAYRNLGTLARIALFDQGDAVVIGDGFRVAPSAGMTISVPAGACLQKISSGDVLACIQTAAQTVTIDAATGAPRTDIVECQIQTVTDKDDTAPVATVASGTTVTITNETVKRDIKYFVKAQKSTNTTTPTAATAGTLTGTVAIAGTIDLSERSKINIADGEDGSYVEIDCQGATPSATTAAEIVSNINTAVGRTMASVGGGSVIVLTGSGTGQTSYFKLKPPADTDTDATAIIFGLSIGGAYKYTYSGTNEWFKVAEINVGAATTTVGATEILDLDEKASWAAGSTDVLVRDTLFSNNFVEDVTFENDVDITENLTVTGNIDGIINELNASSPLGVPIANYGNIAIVGKGNSCMGSITSGMHNIAMGNVALNLLIGGTGNVAIGVGALQYNTVSYNTAIGYNALQQNSTGDGNTAIGYQSLTSNTVGNSNVAIGYEAMEENTTGVNNTAIGRRALWSNTTGDQNTIIGGYSGNIISTGRQNSCLGAGSGSTITTGDNNTCIGYNAEPTSATADNQITLGDGNVTILRCQATTITSLSDERDKTNINSLTIGLDLINKIKPKTFNWDQREWYKDGKPDGSKKSDITEMNLIAQDIIKIEKDLDIEWMGLVEKGNPDRYEVNPGKLLMPVIISIQELSERLKTLEEKINNA